MKWNGQKMVRMKTAYCFNHKMLEDIIAIRLVQRIIGDPRAKIVTGKLRCGQITEFVASGDQVSQWMIEHS